ncbi:MAG: 2-hydroxyacyl-CoA dehydratase [Firmicutes bacterium]|nr:2-hydroxyacyl-CoA dehydratase [Bacillota bacterium]MBR5731619.1 2-hydroxyacyl-CoA dehydratase [Bacillota bacterium]
MAIRECALKNQHFARLYDVYLHRDDAALAYKKAGGKVLAKLGSDVPDELVLAAGMMPVQVYADPDKELVYTNKILEFAFDPVVRKQFEKMIDGTYREVADFLAVSNSTDEFIRVFLYLREMIRSMPEMPVPPTTFIDMLFTRNRMHQERNEFIFGLFRKQLEEWSGKPVTDEAIKVAAAICNADRAALRRIGELRHGDEVRVSGTEALVIIGSGFFMDKKEHTDLVEKLAEEAAEWPVITGKRVFVTGSAHEDLLVYDMIEKAGGVVVAEDHDWGDRSYDRDYNTEYPPIRAIVDRYMLRGYSGKKAFVSQRVEALNEEVAAAKADAVLFYTNIYEDSASWDYPSQKKSLDEQGIKNALFAKMLYPATANEDLQARIAEFIEG